MSTSVQRTATPTDTTEFAQRAAAAWIRAADAGVIDADELGYLLSHLLSAAPVPAQR
jgi:hypothetical protein